MDTDPGNMPLLMDMSGHRALLPDGPLIRQADGRGWITTVGTGSATIPGVGLLITMGAGSITQTAGAGGRARVESARSGGLRWWRGLDGVAGELA